MHEGDVEQALALKFRFLSIRFASEAFVSNRNMSGVEKRRSDSSLPVAIGAAFATPPQSGLT